MKRLQRWIEVEMKDRVAVALPVDILSAVFLRPFFRFVSEIAHGALTYATRAWRPWPLFMIINCA
jgi:hypothetical protein